MGAAVAADDNNAVGTVVPQSSTNDKDTYVSASVAFEGVCLGAFANSDDESASASALLPPFCHCCEALPPCFALLPPPLTLPPPPRRRQASANVALARCQHRQHRAVALPLPPLTLPLLLRCRQAAPNVVLSCCRHRRSLGAAATTLLPSRCAQPPCFALPPPPLTLLPIYVVVNIYKY